MVHDKGDFRLVKDGIESGGLDLVDSDGRRDIVAEYKVKFRLDKLSGADFGIGITGVAGPGPDGDRPEGEIYIALVSEKTDEVFLLEDRSENERNKHRVQAAEAALTMLDAQLSRQP